MGFVQARGVSLSFGDRDVLRDITVSIGSGDRTALTGANGSGKTTLMKILASNMKPDSGDVIASRESRISYLPQSGIVLAGHTLYEEAEKAFDPIRNLEKELESLGSELSIHTDQSETTEKLLFRHHELQERIEASGFYARRERIDRVLSGLGFKRIDLDRRTDEFSGGWQMRIALAKVLLEDPDIMLLDEPTNYLDLEATAWLKDYLSSFAGGILVVSHDRFFLDAVVRDVAELFAGRLRKYHGNFSEYQAVRSRELEALLEQYERQQEEISRIQDFVDRFRYNASKAQLVQSRIKQLEKIVPIEIPETMKRISFTFPDPPHSGRTVLSVKNLTKSYGDHTVFRGLDLEIERGEKLVISGKNGAGKSSLMRIIAGSDSSFSGEFTYGKDVKPGYFSQDQESALDHAKTALEEIESVSPTDLYPKLRNLLGSFLFSGDDIYKRIEVLSGGEKSRLALLKLLLRPVNFLILDEPTNHLDMHSKDVLLEALRTYPGTVVFVSHDRHFIDALATKVFALEDGGPKPYYGNYSYYLWKKEQEDSGIDDAPVLRSPEIIPVQSQNAAAREEQKKVKALQRRLEREEHEIMEKLDALDQEHAELEESLSLPEVYTDGERVRAVKKRLEENEAEQSELSSRWEAVGLELDAAGKGIVDPQV